MATAFNHFVRFLIEHEQPRNPYLTHIVSGGCFGFLLAILLFQINAIAAIALFIFMACYPLAQYHLHNRKSERERKIIPAEIHETWELLRWMGHQRSLNHRTHPKLRELLEDIAAIRRRTLDALDSPTWQERSKAPEGAQAKQDVMRTLDHALYDAVFIGRHLFRGKGQRETTFHQRCQDPKFGAHALESIGQLHDEVLSLSESAIAAGEQSDLRLELTKGRIQALVDAERELEQSLGPADTLD